MNNKKNHLIIGNITKEKIIMDQQILDDKLALICGALRKFKNENNLFCEISHSWLGPDYAWIAKQITIGSTEEEFNKGDKMFYITLDERGNCILESLDHIKETAHIFAEMELKDEHIQEGLMLFMKYLEINIK